MYTKIYSFINKPTLTDESFFPCTAPSHVLDPHMQRSQPLLHLPLRLFVHGCGELSYTADQSDTAVNNIHENQ
jgi:hypothetical protein